MPYEQVHLDLGLGAVGGVTPSSTAVGAAFGLALVALGAGDLDQAADWLEKVIEQRDIWGSFLVEPPLARTR